MALTVAELETAIQTVTTSGQSVTLDGMTYSAANLQTLVDLLNQVQQAADRASSRPVFTAFKMTNMGY